MPKLDLFTAPQAQPAPGVPQINPRAADIGVERIARAGGQLGNALVRVGVQEAEDKARDEAATIVADATTRQLEILIESEQSAEEGAPDFAKKFERQFNEFSVQARNKASRLASPLVKQRLDGLKPRLMERALQFESRAITRKARADFEDVLDRQANLVIGEPSLLDDSLEALNDRIEATILSGDQKRQLRETTQSRLAAAAIDGAMQRTPGALLESLNEGDFDDLLTPAQKATAITQAQAKVKAARRELEAELDGDVRDAVFVIGNGHMPPNIESLQRRAKGTKFGPVLDDALTDAGRLHNFMRQPLSEQRALLRTTSDTITARELRLRQRQQKAHATIVSAIKKGDGLVVASDLGIVEPLEGIELSRPVTLKERAAKARVASEHFGTEVSPLTPTEADAIGDQITEESPDAAVGTMQALVSGLGQNGAGQVAADIVEKKPALSMALVTVDDRPLVAREIVNGERLLAGNPDVKPKAADRQASVETVFGSLFEGTDATALAPIIAGANAIYANRKVPTGDFAFDPDVYEKALHDAVGGVLEHNGRELIAPVPGMTEDELEDLLDTVEQSELIRFGTGNPVSGGGKDLTADMLRDAQLVSSSFDGKVLVLFPGLGFVITEDGTEYELDLGALAASGRTRVGGGGGL